MKKTLAIVLMMVVLVMGTMPALADHVIADLGEQSSISSVDILGTKIVCIDNSDDALVVYDFDTKKMRNVPLHTSDTFTNLYGGFVFNGNYYVSMEDNGVLRHVLNASGEAPSVAEDITIPVNVSWNECYMNNFYGTDSSIYFVLNSFISDKRDQYRIDMTTGEIFAQRNISYYHYFPYKNNEILIVKYEEEEEKQLYTFDLKGGTQTLVASVPLDASGFCFDETMDTLYYTSASTLMKSDHFQEATAVSPIPFRPEAGPTMLLNSQYYITSKYNGLLYFHDLSAQANSQTLSIIGGTDRSEGHKKFLMEHPQVSVDINDALLKEESTSDFINALLTDSVDFDLMLLNTLDYDLQILIEKGYCMEIGTNEAIAANVKTMYPSLQAAVTDNDKLYAVPISISVFPWDSVYLHNWLGAGLAQEDIPTNFTDFLQFLEQWADSDPDYAISENTEYKEWLFSMMLDRYVGEYQVRKENLTFLTPLFSNMLDQVSHTTAALRGFRVAGPALLSYADLLGRTDSLLVLPLSNESTPLLRGNAEVYLINPRSEKKELALKYVLSCLENMEDQAKIKLYPEFTQPIEAPYYLSTKALIGNQMEALNAKLNEHDVNLTAIAKNSIDDELGQLIAELDALEDSRYSVSADDIADYKTSIAPLLYFPSPNVFESDSSDVLQALVDRYLSGGIDKQDFIAELESKIQVMQME